MRAYIAQAFGYIYVEVASDGVASIDAFPSPYIISVLELVASRSCSIQLTPCAFHQRESGASLMDSALARVESAVAGLHLCDGCPGKHPPILRLKKHTSTRPAYRTYSPNTPISLLFTLYCYHDICTRYPQQVAVCLLQHKLPSSSQASIAHPRRDSRYWRLARSALQNSSNTF